MRKEGREKKGSLYLWALSKRTGGKGLAREAYFLITIKKVVKKKITDSKPLKFD